MGRAGPALVLLSNGQHGPVMAGFVADAVYRFNMREELVRLWRRKGPKCSGASTSCTSWKAHSVLPAGGSRLQTQEKPVIFLGVWSKKAHVPVPRPVGGVLSYWGRFSLFLLFKPWTHWIRSTNGRKGVFLTQSADSNVNVQKHLHGHTQNYVWISGLPWPRQVDTCSILFFVTKLNKEIQM